MPYKLLLLTVKSNILISLISNHPQVNLHNLRKTVEYLHFFNSVINCCRSYLSSNGLNVLSKPIMTTDDNELVIICANYIQTEESAGNEVLYSVWRWMVCSQ